MRHKPRPQKKTEWLKAQCEPYHGIYLRRIVRPGQYSVPGHRVIETQRRPE
jgi:hypothetical protein